MCVCARVHEHVRACGVDVVVPVSARAAEARAVPPQASSASAGQWLDSGSVPVGREQHVQGVRIQVDSLAFCTQIGIQHAASAGIPPRKAGPAHVAPRRLRVRGRVERT